MSRTTLPSFFVTLKSTSSFSALTPFSALTLRPPSSLTALGPRSLAFSASRRATLARRSAPSSSESESERVSSIVFRLAFFFCGAGSDVPAPTAAGGEDDSRASRQPEARLPRRTLLARDRIS